MPAATATRTADPGFSMFLTAYDPSDLPGGSIDPLGFERGYLFLAEKILPGLTNVADRPRYFSVLCAGASLATVTASDSPRRQYQSRLDCVARLERFWALANVLACREDAETELTLTGIRGVTYAMERADSLQRKGMRRSNADFPLLSRQIPYGVVGIYGAVADKMRLLDRKTLAITPDLGEQLAEGFLAETEFPDILRRAVRDNGDVPLATLAEWGRRAHVSGSTLPSEAACIREALGRDPVRSRMVEVLEKCPFRKGGDTELSRLERLRPILGRNPANQDLCEAVETILAYESCYRLAALAFERLLWTCRSASAGSVGVADLNADPVLQQVCRQLPPQSQRFGAVLDSVRTEQFRLDLHRLGDARRFLECAAVACVDPQSLIGEVMSRHADVQRGKFDRGRRKMPWVELVGNRISMTMTRVGGFDKEVTQPADVVSHPYRLSSADSFIAAAGAV